MSTTRKFRLPPKSEQQKELLAVESGLGVDGLLALAAALTPSSVDLLKHQSKSPRVAVDLQKSAATKR